MSLPTSVPRALRELAALGGALALLAALAPHAARAQYTESPSIHQAIAARDRGAVEQMLSAGADLEEREEHGRTPLYAASRDGQADLVIALIAAGAQPNAPNFAGITPLHVAAARGHTDIVRTLVANCAEIDARDLQKRTPLYLAAARGHREVARILVANGADVNARLPGGSTPLQVAMTFGQEEAAQVLRARAEEELAYAAAGVQPDVAAAPRSSGDAERVRYVQEKLRELGYDPGEANGRLNDRTRKAIGSFQRKIGQVETSSLTGCLVQRVELEWQARQPRPELPPADAAPAAVPARAPARSTGMDRPIPTSRGVRATQ
jgi:hypothetical protein